MNLQHIECKMNEDIKLRKYDLSDYDQVINIYQFSSCQTRTISTIVNIVYRKGTLQLQLFPEICQQFYLRFVQKLS